MTRDDELSRVRREYAQCITRTAQCITRATVLNDPRLEDALAELRREDFLPPGPWQLQRFSPERYEQTPNDDPISLYEDVPVAIMPGLRLNNGQPSFVVSLISAGRLQPGERVVHIGTGLGYYTAVMRCLDGPTGYVTGIEYEAELACRAKANLARYANVHVVQGDGSTATLEPADVIYVNAGASRPVDAWLDALNLGGRLILPLTVSYTTEAGHTMTSGAVFLIERQADGYAARALSHVGIYPCVGARDDASEEALKESFRKGAWNG